MSLEKVKAYLAQFGMTGRILEFPVSSATVELAAAALRVEPGRIAKTLSFLEGEQAILIVAAGDARIDNPRFKACFHHRAHMIPPDQVEAMVGHAVGGVCPFAVRSGVTIYLDDSLKRFSTVFPACGTSNSAIELTLPELERASGSSAWVSVCRLPETPAKA